MTTDKRLVLEQKIEEFLEHVCHESEPEGYVHNDIVNDMSDAAETVWDAIMKYQEFAIDEKLHSK